MLEVLLPFLFMKQTEREEPDTDESPLNADSTAASHRVPRKLREMVRGGTGSKRFDLACVYAFFKRFVKCFIPNNLHNKFNGRNQSLPYLSCCLSLIDLLLAYIDKDIAHHFKQKRI